MFYDINGIIQVGNSNFVLVLLTLSFTLSAAISPMAGLLTDVKLSRYKVVGCTSYAIIIKVLIMSMGLIVSIKTFWYLIGSFILRICIYSIFTSLILVYMLFIINAFHFGMDQLHDSSTEDSILFIHWYVWIYYTCTFIAEVSWNLVMHDSYYYGHFDRLRISGISIVGLVFLIALLALISSLCTVRYKKVWFLFEPVGVNPYKLVYKVVRFAYQHKVPLRRSAFTYCDEESQTRLDVGKHKYGGPFTTKQVEDVKAFWGILKVLISIGPAFLLQTVTQTILPMFSKHNKLFLHIGNDSKNTTFHYEVHPEGLTRHILISNGLFSPLLVVICIPLYLCWIRPWIKYYIPGILNRIHLAMAIMTLSLVGFLAMDVVVHLVDNVNANCMFQSYAERNIDIAVEIKVNFLPVALPLYQSMAFLTTQLVVSALANMLLDIAVLEFVCSQSPYSMKGLLLGIFFSLRSLFQGIAIVLILPFGMVWKIESLSCGSGFYAMNIVIGLLEFVLFSCVSKRYKYREVNEPSNEYRYAEEYYSNIVHSRARINDMQ